MTIAISHRKNEPAISKRTVCACGRQAIRNSSAGPVCQHCSDIERRTFDYHSIERRNNHGGNRKGSGRKPANVNA